MIYNYTEYPFSDAEKEIIKVNNAAAMTGMYGTAEELRLKLVRMVNERQGAHARAIRSRERVDKVFVVLPCGKRGQNVSCAADCPLGLGKTNLTLPNNAIEQCYRLGRRRIAK